MEKENKNLKIIIALLSVLIVILLALGIYFVFIKKENEGVIDNQKPNNTQVNGGQKEQDKNIDHRLYHIVDGDDYVLYTDGTIVENKISFDYPQFDINTDEFRRANSEISNLYKQRYDSLLKESINPTDAEYYISKNGSKYGSSEIFIPSYNISETDKYLSILIIDKRYCNCSGQISGYGYVVDKVSKKLLSNEEILKLFDVSKQDFINYYNEYGGCHIDNDNKISSLDNQKIFIKDKELYFENATCCCNEISKYGVIY